MADVIQRRTHLCQSGWEPALQGELSRVFPLAEHTVLAPGWLDSRLSSLDAAGVPSVALAQQCLPHASDLTAPSISQWVKLLGQAVIERLADHDGPWRWHLFSHYATEAAAGLQRCRLIQQGLDEHLRKKQRRLLRSRQLDMLAPWQADEVLLQAGLLTPTRGLLSYCPADERHRLRRVISRFPAGEVAVPRDPQAPSRAFAKLVEAQTRLGERIGLGQTCVDLGSSPGGWAYVALALGAQVVAIDRSPLREDLMDHPRLTFLQADAFKYLPEAPVDWLLSDVVAFPPRIVELLETWLSRGLCRRFCVTIKFRGAEDYPRLEAIKRLLAGYPIEFYLRRLTANGNEVTAYGGVP